MRVASSTFVVMVSLAAAACGGGTSADSSPIPSPGSVTFNLSGSVRDAQDSSLMPGVLIEIASGAEAGRFDYTDASGNYTFPGLRVGAFVVRFSQNGFETLDRTISASQDMRLDVMLRHGPSCTAPAVPAGFRVDVAGSTVTYSWNAVAGASDYLLGIGTTRGSSRTRSTNTTQLSYVWRGQPSGVYFARVVARNACGRSNASNEVTFTVGTPAS